LAERELEQIEADALNGGDLPLAERLSTDCTLSLNEAFSEVLENSSDKLSWRTFSGPSSYFFSKFSFGSSQGFSPELSSELDVDWKRKQGKLSYFIIIFFIIGNKNRLRFERVHAYFPLHEVTRIISNPFSPPPGPAWDGSPWQDCPIH